MINNFTLLKPVVSLAAALLLMIYSTVVLPDPGQIQQLIVQDKLDQALKLTNSELAKDKGNVTYQFLKGLILTRQEKLEQARDIFLELTRSNPELPEPYNNLAVVYAAMGDFDKARQSLEEAINTHPSYATAHENIGDIYAKLASQAYNQALELDSDNNAAKAKLSLVNELFSMPNGEQQPVLLAGTTQHDVDKQAERQQQEIQSRQQEEKLAAEKLAQQKQAANKELLDRQQQEERQRNQQEQKLVVEVKQAVLDWAQVWTAQNVTAYLAAYASDFSPVDGQSASAWRLSRQERLSRPGTIKVTISDLVVAMQGSERAQATFTQVYQSNIYGDRVKKTLVLKLEAGKWLITQEQTS